ncbi:hypothetical protein [Halomonas piscis]|uniref:hypothetical protein n=1 Tax=Halomonas piscis TaxID=3031727 RepID=UPI0028A23F80|nr:hypothetical protein [Halomonas piscis]
MNQQQSLDVLVQRLRDSASSLDPEHPPLGPPMGEWQYRLSRLRDYHQRAFVSDPQRPLLSELLAIGHDDAEFLHIAYGYLLGRAADAEGREHYRSHIASRGRLYVLVELAYAREGQKYRQNHAVDLPDELTRLLNCRACLAYLGPLQGAVLRLWSRLLARLMSLRASRWVREARIQHFADEIPFMADALLELDERQNHLMAQQQSAYTRQRSAEQQAAPFTPSEEYQAFVAACEAELAERALDVSSLNDDCIKARRAGRYAHQLGHTPPQWCIRLGEWGFDASRAHNDLQSAPPHGLALVSGFGLVIRVSLPQLHELVAASRHALAPGGMLLLDIPPAGGLLPSEHRPAPQIIERLLKFHGFTNCGWRDLRPAGSDIPHDALVGFTPGEHT